MMNDEWQNDERISVESRGETQTAKAVKSARCRGGVSPLHTVRAGKPCPYKNNPLAPFGNPQLKLGVFGEF
ncbi:MAG: hypothetical protein Kow0090_05900 [Myxococcota bacterium]